ncbi:MAG: S8 family serine peptidase [Bacillota bacterium]|nr:S8 family serine peptidase [Bacillota bacterium]
MKKSVKFSILFIITLLFTGCSISNQKQSKKITKEFTKKQMNQNQNSNEAISQYNTSFLKKDYLKISKKDLKSLNSEKLVDFKNVDLSDLNLKQQYSLLTKAEFDLKTKWPETLPDNFIPGKIIKMNNNPGLGINGLHDMGINGKGIGIAIIDEPLLTTHNEIKGQLKYYKEILPISGDEKHTASEHGTAVSSITVGKSVGVAPGANLYFIAVDTISNTGNEVKKDHTYEAEAINQIIAINKNLKEKIRVISISDGWIKGEKAYDKMNTAVKAAQKEGIFVISSSLVDYSGYFFDGLGKIPMGDPDVLDSYTASLQYHEYYLKENNIKAFFEKRVLENFKIKRKINQILYVPMDSRTVASPTSNDNYSYLPRGGWSFCSPYIAGVYALCCQVMPNITPEIFYNKALETGSKLYVTDNNTVYTLEKVINPTKLIEVLKNIKSNKK